MSEARQALRKILRAVDQHLTSANGNKQWRDHVIKEFRSTANIENAATQKQKVQEAKDYAYLVNSVQEHRALLLSYNIGIDREQERRKLMSDTAARVGLRMPKYAEENDSS
ncbi:hypothetical protein ABBQ38_012517 [Trebouxia sp. C0009 RCD-2024]